MGQAPSVDYTKRKKKMKKRGLYIAEPFPPCQSCSNLIKPSTEISNKTGTKTQDEDYDDD
jgi:hypothetical protein